MFKKNAMINYETAYFSDFSPYRGYRVSDTTIVLSKNCIRRGDETVLSSKNNIRLTTIVHPVSNAELVFIDTIVDNNESATVIGKFCAEFTELKDFIVNNDTNLPAKTVLNGIDGYKIAVKHRYVMKGVR